MSNITFYPNIVLVSIVSCMTLTEGELSVPSNGQIYEDAVIPSLNISFTPEESFMQYYIGNDNISATTSNIGRNDFDDYGIVKSFANKMLADESPIDDEIQKAINDHFWDML